MCWLSYIHNREFFMITSNGTADRDTIKKEEKWKHKKHFLFRHRTLFKMIKNKFATFFHCWTFFLYFLYFLAFFSQFLPDAHFCFFFLFFNEVSSEDDNEENDEFFFFCSYNEEKKKKIMIRDEWEWTWFGREIFS